MNLDEVEDKESPQIRTFKIVSASRIKYYTVYLKLIERLLPVTLYYFTLSYPKIKSSKLNKAFFGIKDGEHLKGFSVTLINITPYTQIR